MKTFITPTVLLLVSLSAFGQRDIQKQFQTQLIEVEDGGTVVFPAGTFHMDGSLSLDGKSNITIKGAGKEKTILNFSDQVTGAEGLKITNGSNIVIQDLRVQNTKGDGIKVQLVNGIS